VLIAITTGGKVGLGIVAGLFIAFAIASSFWFPRRNPDFPGNRLGLFIALTATLFAATIAGVVFFATESEEEHGGAEAAETQTATGETTGESTGEETGEETAPPAGGGNPDAGESVFASAGCGGCHTLSAAGASGNVGPNLDEAKPNHALVIDRVSHGKGVMPSFEGQLDDQQIEDVAAFVVQSTSG
jgi:mono/diheme cytochrome c family protein